MKKMDYETIIWIFFITFIFLPFLLSSNYGIIEMLITGASLCFAYERTRISSRDTEIIPTELIKGLARKLINMLYLYLFNTKYMWTFLPLVFIANFLVMLCFSTAIMWILETFAVHFMLQVQL